MRKWTAFVITSIRIAGPSEQLDRLLEGDSPLLHVNLGRTWEPNFCPSDSRSPPLIPIP